MKTPPDVLNALTVSYDRSWRDWLIEARPTPAPRSLDAPDGKQITADHERVATWIHQWTEWAAAHPGTHLTGTSVRTPFGNQYRPTHLHIDTFDSLAALIGRGHHWATATTRWQLLASTWPDALPTLKPHLAGLTELTDTDFAILLKAAAWLREHPRSGLMPRQVPVAGMHSKWLKSHRTRLLALFAPAKPPAAAMAPHRSPGLDPDEAPSEDLDALGLRPRPHLLDLILTDPDDRKRLHGLRHLAAPEPELAGLPLTPQVVLIVENKESAFIVPDYPGLVVIHSLGEHIDVLPRLPWMRNAKALYWGDLDRTGMVILAAARAVYPTLKSTLMDRRTLTRFQWLAVTDTTAARTPGPHLTTEETATYHALTNPYPSCGIEGPLRLEQERLPADEVIAALRNDVSAAIHDHHPVPLGDHHV